MSNEYVTELFDKDGNLVGALLTAEAWTSVKKRFGAELGFGKPEEPVRPEPLKDWETLKELWGFNYPVDMDVACTCGNETKDWSADEPRLFRLSAATIGGLVTFTCTKCRAKVVKKHFKDQIKVEVQPYQDEKRKDKEALYD